MGLTCNPWSPVKSNRIFRCYCPKAWPLPPGPLAIVGFLVAGLVARQYSDRLGYCWRVVFLLFGIFAGLLYCNVRKFLDVSFDCISLALAVASLVVSLQLLTIAQCDRFDGLLRCRFFRCLVIVFAEILC